MQTASSGRRRGPVRPRPRLQLTARDRGLLGFIADHRLILADHAQALLDTTASAARTRLSALVRAGFIVQHRVFHHQAACYQVSARGRAAIGSTLPPPRLDLREYMHDVGVAWVWLAARAGAFGTPREVISERQLRSRDGLPRRAGELDLSASPRDERLGVHLVGFGRSGREQRHYPDLLVDTDDGRRIALELELSAKGRARRERILTGYALDRRIDTVVYLVNRPAVERSIRASIATLSVSPRVQVQPFAWSPSMRALEQHLAVGRGPTARTGPARQEP